VVTILPPIYAVKVFHGGAGLLGILLASIGVGGIIGGIVTAYLARLERWGLLQLGSIFLLGLSLIAFRVQHCNLDGLTAAGCSGNV